MSYTHTTQGGQGFEGFRQALKLLSITHWESPNTRKAWFLAKSPETGKQCVMVLEEYLAFRDHDCDGMSMLAYVVYEDGKRPNVESLMRDSGEDGYPDDDYDYLDDNPLG